MSTIGTFGGRGMGQTCGVADPSQWMRVFGIDIDSRDTIELLDTAKKIEGKEIETLGGHLYLFSPLKDIVSAELE